MPVTDSIQTVSDSASLVLDSLHRNDSVLVADSITRADSIAYADSLRLHAFKGYEGELLSGVPANQSWVFVLLLALFGIIVLAFIRSISPPQNIFLSFFSKKDRTSIFSKSSIDSFEQKFYFQLFSLLSISLYSYLLFYKHGTNFEFLIYLRFLFVVIVFFLVKYILSKLLEYVFFDKGGVKMLFESYLHVITMAATVFYVLSIIQIYTKIVSDNFAVISGIIVLVLSFMLFTARMIQIFLHKIVVSLYLLLYLCTLEILPVFVLIEAFWFITKSV